MKLQNKARGTRQHKIVIHAEKLLFPFEEKRETEEEEIHTNDFFNEIISYPFLRTTRQTKEGEKRNKKMEFRKYLWAFPVNISESDLTLQVIAFAHGFWAFLEGTFQKRNDVFLMRSMPTFPRPKHIRSQGQSDADKSIFPFGKRKKD